MSSPDATAKLKCKFCSARFNRWKTLKNGDKVDGFETVRDHIMLYHPDEATKLEMKW